jgi:hypothetical protein
VGLVAGALPAAVTAGARRVLLVAALVVETVKLRARRTEHPLTAATLITTTTTGAPRLNMAAAA